MINSLIKVFIIAYDFPPKKNTAAQRPFGWLKYFPENDLYPIIITKDWDNAESEITDRYEIHRIKCDPTIQEKYWQRNDNLGKLKRKIAGVFDLFFHTSFYFGPYAELYRKALELIKSTRGQKILIVTAMPFGIFRVANKLHNATGIKWVADYRDDWTTTELNQKPLQKLVYKLIDSYIEKKLISSATLITSVSQYYVDKITALFDGEIKGLVVQNGYFNEEIEELQIEQKTKDISFVYVGSLYSSQNIKPVLIAIAKASLQLRVKFIFLGTPLARQLKKEFTDIAHDTHLEIIFYDRLPKQDALKIQQKCHYAVIVPHTGLKGIPSSKLYEFIGSKMPVLYYPNDHDIIDQIMNETGLGVSAVESAELDQIVEQLVSGNFVFSCNHEACNGFTRENSTSLFCDELKKVIR